MIPKNYDEVIEVMCRGACIGDPDSDFDGQPMWTIHKADMKAVFDAVFEAGVRFVPEEPTAEQLAAFDAACDENRQVMVKYGYKTMVNTSPYRKE